MSIGNKGPSVLALRRFMKNANAVFDENVNFTGSFMSTHRSSSSATPTSFLMSTQNIFDQSQVNFTEKKWVWVPDEKEGYIAGYIIEELDGIAKIHLMNGMVSTKLFFFPLNPCLL
ncbi:hypothetical protein AX774_g2441 [Zancudomyces culisetae]|uniref:Myosin N-terminal SH3-like domain-containing protein n=1 Tax=Zancudomyces culisetae TaxID=1213189 RepID=A0A1R1PSW5_ZANCU|nr:hypothetical protein AX774_g2441 [Zancudomyces culisetae]|eukprot:OMH84041.1 hypothetical protein AX774_g2441 [Zancudomyces culisetae]